jgi:hypothetical protein
MKSPTRATSAWRVFWLTFLVVEVVAMLWGADFGAHFFEGPPTDSERWSGFRDGAVAAGMVAAIPALVVASIAKWIYTKSRRESSAGSG